MEQEYRLPRGTQDFLPDNAEKSAYVEYMLKSVASLYGYREIRTPIFEHTNLFLRSVGESSDIVNKEMYTFLDKGDRSITLRPEGTAGVIRAFVENKLFTTPDLPIKLFYYGPIFRYERPGAGRYRQINQFGFECLGIKTPLIDAELILMVTCMLYSIGLKKFKIKINSLGDKESRENYKNVLKNYFEKHLDELCDDCKRRFTQNPLRILDCKVDGESKLIKNAPKILDHLNNKSKEYLNELLKTLDKYGVPYELDAALVRGLDYYSDTVFEIHASTADGKDYGAIGGGGRYDGLVEELGGPATPAIGLAFGVERLVLLLESYGYFEKMTNRVEAYIMPMAKEYNEYAMQILTFIRNYGIKAEMDYLNKSLRAQFKTIERQNIPLAIIIGETEAKNNTVTVKDTNTKEQETVALNLLVSYLSKKLEEGNNCNCGHNHNEEEGCHCGHDHNGEHNCDCHDDNCDCDDDCSDGNCHCKDK